MEHGLLKAKKYSIYFKKYLLKNKKNLNVMSEILIFYNSWEIMLLESRFTAWKKMKLIQTLALNSLL